MTEVSPGINPWAAARPGVDLLALARDIREARASFADRSPTRHRVRSVVLDSWQRSLERGVDPDAAGRDSLGTNDLRRYRDEHPMRLIRPVVRNLLLDDGFDDGMVVALSDANGLLLWVEGQTTALDSAASMNFSEGSDWSESTVGTNAPGTALTLDHALQILGAEHFSHSVQNWSCTAAPVHHPTTGRILGVLDVTGGPRVAAPEILSLVRATVVAAEAELRVQALENPGILGSVGGARLEVLAGARPVFIRDGARTELSGRHAEILLLLAEHPEGLAGDRLAVLLDESDLDAVTVRAEVSRMRRVVGPGLIGSRPYRLQGELSTDLDDVRRAIDRGDIDRALRLYGAPVLHRSSAPGIQDIREALRMALRAAVVASGDAALLGRWITSPHGRDDIEAWVAYRATLDPRSSMHAKVQTRIERWA